ncbi:hypothetical protein [Octadecabacter ascidiaceicola]|uniref:Uncharacterized protein n=1 Tax=Octadecabacter ascidiaceicola TaxID=1655543 RepID=A0A238JN94_9RHOB|nr:hypothetical protein [Octadecabacter ascidiaceicola]SMX31684.1 hypothetical protein OCA8868_00487 [Octadecabacter ascidiaceicola]
MKYAAIALMCLTGAAHAESFCGVTDEGVILSDLSNTLQMGAKWDLTGALTFSQGGEGFTDPLVGIVTLTSLGMISLEVGGSRGDNLFLAPNKGSYDDEDLAKLFTRTGTEWITQEVAESPCNLNEVLQMRGTYDDPNGDLNQVSIVPYSSDHVVMIAEIEALTEGGLAFVTIVGLMTRQ